MVIQRDGVLSVISVVIKCGCIGVLFALAVLSTVNTPMYAISITCIVILLLSIILDGFISSIFCGVLDREMLLLNRRRILRGVLGGVHVIVFILLMIIGISCSANKGTWRYYYSSSSAKKCFGELSGIDQCTSDEQCWEEYDNRCAIDKSSLYAPLLWGGFGINILYMVIVALIWMVDNKDPPPVTKQRETRYSLPVGDPSVTVTDDNTLSPNDDDQPDSSSEDGTVPALRFEIVHKSESLVSKGTVQVINFDETEKKKSCVAYVMELTMMTNSIEHIVKDVQKWYGDISSANNFNPWALLDDEVMAIGFYTYDLGIKAKSKADNFYYQFNKALKSRDQNFHAFRGYIYHLQMGLSRLPDFKGNVYRGVPDAKFIIENYTDRRKIHWASYSSTTTELSVAKQFAGDGGIVIKIDIINGKSIYDYSFLPVEHEILLSPNMCFVVNGDVYKEDGIMMLNMIQMNEEKETFVF